MAERVLMNARDQTLGGGRSKMRQEGGQPATILLVEDDEFVRVVTNQILRNAGFVVLCARDGVEAIEIARCHEGTIDLMFSDVILPGKTGPEVGLELRRERPQIKLLFTSGYGDVETEPGEIIPDGTFYLVKPFSVGSLVHKVEEVLAFETKGAAMSAGG